MSTTEIKKDKKVDIFDIETIVNCFTYTGVNRDTDKVYVYVIWNDRNDLKLLLEHLKGLRGMIGFNSLAFDYPVIHEIIKNEKKFLKYSTDRLARKIYQIAQEIILKSNAGGWTQIREPFIPQIDLFKVHHFDNRAKMTSLKKLEIAMQFENVADMPHHHTQEVESQETLDELLAYNLNDVIATKLFLDKTKDKIALRRGLEKRYGLNCLNYSDSKIGEELMLKLYCENTNQNPNLVKKARTYRGIFRFEECIPDYVKFHTPEFNHLLEYLKSQVVEELKDSFKYSFEYKGFTFDLGTGGIHGCIKSGVYESDEEKIIIDSDVECGVLTY